MNRASLRLLFAFCFTLSVVRGARRCAFETPSSLTNNQSPALTQGHGEPPLAPGTARLYSMRFCPYAERVMLYIAFKNIPVEVINIHLGSMPWWYFRKSPKGDVPAFEKDGQIVVGSGDIPDYLDRIYPESIQGADARFRGQQKIIAEHLGTLATTFGGLLDALMGKGGWWAKDQKLNEMLDAMDDAELLLPGDYFGGTSPGLPDFSCLPFLKRLHASAILQLISGVDTTSFPGAKRFPKLTAWYARISETTAVKAAIQPIQHIAGFLRGSLSGYANYDYGLEYC